MLPPENILRAGLVIIIKERGFIVDPLSMVRGLC
jgi:hypothetical protein